jgi:O-antigen ligase
MTRSQSQLPKERLFAALFGAFLGLALLKFGNPPIMETWVTAPTNAYEFVLNSPWPINWAYWLFGTVACVGLMCARWRLELMKEKRAMRWLLAIPLAWLLWQILATSQSLDARLSSPTLLHFVVCVACFYLGFLSLPAHNLRLFWAGLVCGLGLVLFSGWEQHFGGLEETRRYFFQYLYPKMPKVSPDYLKKMSSNRIFATLFYPNALAGALLLLLPPTCVWIWRLEQTLTIGARTFLIAVLGLGALGCLYWSGSKGGWLLMLLLGLIALLKLPFGRNWKVLIVGVVLVLGLAGFFWKYAGFFQKGATSVGARFDYWRAAVQTARQYPLFGTGPGTFAIPYQRVKKQESEMTRLVHNDYLEQASDSGIVGALLYTSLLLWGLCRSHENGTARTDTQAFAVWLGVLGWALQGFVEFSLYIPALAWPAFTLLGWLLRVRSV